MKTTCAAVFASALLASLTMAQTPICTPSDGDSIRAWMSACDSVAGSTAAKCADEGCHAALHRLEEEETVECWMYLGLGSRANFAKYKATDAFCHSEGPDPDVT